MCAIVRDEDRYIHEWVAFHHSLGVQEFLIIDNGENSKLNYVLDGFIKAGVVKLRRFSSRRKPQREAYDRALKFYQGKARWLGFFDVDEFVFPLIAKTIPEALAEFENFAGVAINWVSFGSGGRLERSEKWVIETYIERGELDHVVELPQLMQKNSSNNLKPDFSPINSHVKCFVDPNQTSFFRSAHHFKFKPGHFAVTESNTPIYGPLSDTVSVEKLRVNHYWSRSLSELAEKLNKGRVSQRKGQLSSGYSPLEASKRELASRGVMDTTILRYLKPAQLDAQLHPPAKERPYLRSVKRLRFKPIDWLESRLRLFEISLRKQLRIFKVSFRA